MANAYNATSLFIVCACSGPMLIENIPTNTLTGSTEVIIMACYCRLYYVFQGFVICINLDSTFAAEIFAFTTLSAVPLEFPTIDRNFFSLCISIMVLGCTDVY